MEIMHYNFRASRVAAPCRSGTGSGLALESATADNRTLKSFTAQKLAQHFDSGCRSGFAFRIGNRQHRSSSC